MDDYSATKERDDNEEFWFGEEDDVDEDLVSEMKDELTKQSSEAKGVDYTNPETSSNASKLISAYHEPASTTSNSKPISSASTTNKPLSTNHASSKPNSTIKDSEAAKNAMSASLLHRLAGPSTGKAGLAKDQTDITRVIAEASEGSKFYQNEKRKDEELNKKIAALLKQRDDLLGMADMPLLEATADKILSELSATRDLSQFIVHIDMDSFYASVEMLDDPSLIGKAFGVGGPSDGGVLSTASYEARKWGVRSGMATYIAKKLCPGLIVVRSHFGRYGEISGVVMDILRRYDPHMDPAGVDEAYLNITEYCTTHSMDPEDCVQEIRKIILEETKLTASAGIAANKMLAKICSEKNKPNGQFRLAHDPDVIVGFMKDLPIRRIPGIGRVSEQLLASIGIKTCGDIYSYRAVLLLLDKHFHLREKLAIHLGLGSTNVRPWPRESRKSVGAERTFHAISDEAKIYEKLDHVARELEEDLERTGYAGHTITLKIKLNTFEVRSRAKTVHKPVRTYDELIAIGKELLAHEMPLTLRLIGLRVTGLKDLRAPETGIKRFFAQVTAEEQSRPTKKRKLTHGEGEAKEDAIYVPEDSEDEPEETVTKRAASASPQRTQTLEADPTRRASSHEPLGSQDAGRSNRVAPVKHPVNSTSKMASSSRTVAESHTCPICSKALQTDNAGLNAHIDWCLSRGAIFEASRSAVRKRDSVDNPAYRSEKGGTRGNVKYTAKGKAVAKAKAKGDIRLAWKQLN